MNLSSVRGRRPFISVWSWGLGLVLLAGTAVAGDMKIAVVDLQRAMIETEDGLRFQATIRKMFETKQRELTSKQQELETQRADLERQRSVLSAEAWQRKAETWQREMIALQELQVTANQEMQVKQGELIQPIQQKMVGIIRRLATQEGFDLILERQAAPYYRSDFEVTDRIITLYNSGAEPAPGTVPPAGPAPGAAAPAPGTGPALLIPPPAAKKP
jgi:outer membrane protein